MHLVGPVGAVDERLHVEVGAALVLFVGVHHIHLEIVERGFDERFVEVAAAQPGHLIQKQVAHLFERLARLGAARHDELPVVGLDGHAAIGAQYLLLLVEIQVEQSGLAVAEDLSYELGRVARRVGCARQAPAQHDVGGFEAVDLPDDRFGNRLLGPELQRGQLFVGLHVAEVLVDGGDHRVGVEVARDADGHVVGHVIGLVVFPDVGDRRILQVLLRAQHGLGAVGMVGEQGGGHRFPYLARVLRERHVLLLVDGLQFGVEAADDGVLEAVGLDACPVVDLVRRDVLDVDGHVLRRVGVRSVGADGGHQLVVFVGNGQFRGFVAYRVDAVVDGRAFGLVRRLAVDFEETFDFIEHRFFGGVVRGAVLLRTLEHQVFEIVGQTRRLGRVVLAAHLHGDVGLDAGSFAVDAHVDLQPVREGVDAGVQRIARDGFVLVLAASRNEHRHRDDGQKQEFFHRYVIERS